MLWSAIEAGAPATPGQVRRALGTAAHGILEDWYSGRVPNWESRPGRLALSGAHKLPGPGTCKHATEFTLGPTPYQYRYKGPGGEWVEQAATVLVLDGIKFLAKVDLRAWDIDASERARLGLPADWCTVDHKTTRTFAVQTTREGVSYCAVKAPAELEFDFAAGLYALDDMHRTGEGFAPMRWVYYKAEGSPDARAVDFLVTRAQAEDTAARMVKRAKHLDLIQSVADAEPNFDQCPKFGGCSRHESKGGPCTARRPMTADLFGGHSGAPLGPDVFGGFSGEPEPMTQPAFDPSLSLAERIKQIQAGTLPGLTTAPAPAPVVAPVVTPPVVEPVASVASGLTPPSALAQMAPAAPVVTLPMLTPPPASEAPAGANGPAAPTPAPEEPKAAPAKAQKAPKPKGVALPAEECTTLESPAVVAITVTGTAQAVRKAFGELS